MTGTAEMADKRVKREMTRFGRRPETVSLNIREPGSALTHFAALILLSAGAAPLLMRAARFGSAYTVAGMVVFLMTSCVLYAASTAYHTIVAGYEVTTVLRKIDHMSISLMIAGTYTPVCLTCLRDTVGIPLLIAIWAMAAAGVMFKLFWVTCPKFLSSALYIGMGWLCVFAMRAIVRELTTEAFLWLLAGGLFYTVGAVIYALHPKKFDAKHIYFGSHEIFHVFIMLGTLCHYILMSKCIVFAS